ncbi:MAG: hypothetical protein VKJ04_07375 [Vampirovibrionales bacterium]|nr:hypothetical protein [Vampirovibrionales bacterium]
MWKDPKFVQKMAFYGVFYILFAVFITVGFFTKDYIRPIASLMVPINDKPFAYTFLVLTAMYWGIVLVTELLIKKKQP